MALRGGSAIAGKGGFRGSMRASKGLRGSGVRFGARRGMIGTPVGSRLRGRASPIGGDFRGMRGGEESFSRITGDSGARLPRKDTRHEKRMGGRELKLPRGSRARSHMYAGKPGETYTASTFRLGPKGLQERATTRKLGWREKVTIADVPGGGEYTKFKGQSGKGLTEAGFEREQVSRDIKEEKQWMKAQKKEQAQYERHQRNLASGAPIDFPE